MNITNIKIKSNNPINLEYNFENLPLEITNQIFLFSENLYAYSLLNRNFNHLSKSFLKLNSDSSKIIFYLDLLGNELLKESDTKRNYSLLKNIGLQNLSQLSQIKTFKDNSLKLFNDKIMQCFLSYNFEYFLELGEKSSYFKASLENISRLREEAANSTNEYFLKYLLDRPDFPLKEKKDIISRAISKDCQSVVAHWIEFIKKNNSLEEFSTEVQKLLNFAEYSSPQCFLFLFKIVEKRQDFKTVFEKMLTRDFEEVACYILQKQPALIENVDRFLKELCQKNLSTILEKVYPLYNFNWDQNFSFLEIAFSEGYEKIIDILLDPIYEQFPFENLPALRSHQKLELLRYSVRNSESCSFELKNFKQKLFSTVLKLFSNTEIADSDLLELTVSHTRPDLFQVLVNYYPYISNKTLQLAIKKANFDFVVMIVEHLKFKGCDLYNIIEGIKSQNPQIVRVLLKKSNLSPHIASQIIKQSIKSGQLEIVELILLSAKGSASSQEINEFLSLSIAKNHSLILEKIIFHYQDQENFEINPEHLILAIEKRNPRSLQILVTLSQFLPLELTSKAILHPDPDVIKVLLKNQLEITYPHNFSIMDYAIKRNDQEMLKMLFQSQTRVMSSESLYVTQKLAKIENNSLMELLISFPEFDLEYVTKNGEVLELQFLFQNLMKFVKTKEFSYNELGIKHLDLLEISKYAKTNWLTFHPEDVNINMGPLIMMNAVYFTNLLNSEMPKNDLFSKNFNDMISLRKLHLLFKNLFYFKTNDFYHLTNFEQESFELSYGINSLKTRFDLNALEDLLKNPSKFISLFTIPNESKIINLLKEVAPDDLKIIFQWASSENYINLIKILFKNFQIEANLKELALCEAISFGKKELIKILINLPNFDLCFKNNFILRLAALKGNLSLLKTFYGKHKEAFAKEAQTLFQIACSHGYMDILKFLHEKQQRKTLNFDPCADGNDAFKKACMYGHTEVVKFLLTHYEVNPRAENNIALRFAQKYNYQEIVQLLRSYI